MGLVDVGLIEWPPLPGVVGALAPSLTGNSLTAVGHACVFVLHLPRTGAYTHVAFRTATITGTNVALTVAMQTVDPATGLNSGTNYGGSDPSVPQVVTGNFGYEFALATPASGVAGDLVAIVITVASATAITTCQIASDSRFLQNVPYIIVRAASNTRSATAPVVALRTSAGYVPVPGCVPAIMNYQIVAYNSGSVPSRRALRIDPPFEGRCVGCRGWQLLGANANLVLRDGSNVAQRTIEFDADNQVSSTAGTRLFFWEPYTISKNAIHRVSLEPVTPTNILSYELDFVSVFGGPSPLNNLPGGTAAHLSTWNGSAWTDVFTRRPLISLLFDEIHDSGTGGSGSYAIFGGAVIR